MEPDGDPEARIRELERSLSDQAFASEQDTRPYEDRPSAHVPVPSFPDTQQYAPPQYGAPHGWTASGSPYYAPPQYVVRKSPRMLWLIPVLIVGVIMIAVVSAIVFFTAGSPQTPSVRPSPPAVPGGSGPVDGPEVQPPTPAPEAPTTVEVGQSVNVSGVEQYKTIICNQGAVSISGMSNTVEIRGDCGMVTVSGFENIVTVQSATTIIASGFDNRVTYSTGTPEVSNSGSGNTVEPG